MSHQFLFTSYRNVEEERVSEPAVEHSWGCTISSSETVESISGQEKKRNSASCCEEPEVQMSPVYSGRQVGM